MNSSLYFVVSAVILSFTMLVSFGLKNRIPTKENKILLALNWIIFICNVIDLLIDLNGSCSYLSRNLSMLMHTLYMLGRQLLIVCFGAYVIVSTEKRIEAAFKGILTAVNVYGLGLTLGNLKFNWLFHIDEQGEYRRADTIFLFYIVLIIYFLFAIQHVVRHGQSLDVSRKVALGVFIVLPCIGAALQFVNPQLYIEGFALTLGMLWILLNVPRTDKMLDPLTGVYNQYAFSKKVVSLSEQKQNAFIMVLRFRDQSNLQNKYGLEVYKKLMSEVAYQIYEKLGKERVFYLQDGRFALEIVAKEEEEAKNTANEILRMLHKEWKIYGRDVEVWLVGALLIYPEDIRGIGDIYNYLEYLEIMPSLKDGKVYEGRHLDIAYLRRYDEIERAIDRALQKTNFDVYFQPIYSTKEKRIVAAEALLRMYDEEMGFISPEEFIPIAEKNGKIVDIGHLVVDCVCQFLQREDIRKYGISYIEVNLSIIECIQAELPEKLEAIIQKYNVDSSQINLEITETALAQNQEILTENMKKISEMGITFSLDDYGTGYSTITYMMTLPFRIVKIDKSILWSSFENEKAMIALCASINMIKDMGMDIVVEGVESEEMAQKLAELGCDYLQGFYFSRPLPETEFLKFLTRKS